MGPGVLAVHPMDYAAAATDSTGGVVGMCEPATLGLVAGAVSVKTRAAGSTRSGRSVVLAPSLDRWSSEGSISVKGFASGAGSRAHPEMERQVTVRSLTTNIDPSIIRGIPAATVLRGFGKSLRRHEFRQQDYLQSATVEQLDDFISHDWASGWLPKALALCLVYNSQAATVGSLVTALALAALQSGLLRVLPMVGGQRPFGYWCEVLCPVVFGLVFVFWQDIRAAMRWRTKMLFLDKYCINQEDAVLRAAGIDGLGGFLKHSDRMVICWTPRYFTRLWCTYEVASWLYLQKPMTQVTFLPLSHAVSVMVGGVTACTVCVLYRLALILIPGLEIPILIAVLAVALPVGMHLLRRLVREIMQLPKQLQQFDVANLGCFCCDTNHRLPGQTVATLPCDRKSVFLTLKSWFEEGLEAGKEDAFLEYFNTEVREFFGPWVLETAGPTRLPYSSTALVGTPFLFRGFDALAFVGYAEATSQAFASVLTYVVIALAALPVAYKSTLHFLVCIETSIGWQNNVCLNLLITVASCMFPGVILFVLCWPMRVASDYGLLAFLGVCLLDAIIAVLAFRRDVARLPCFGWMGCTRAPHGTGRRSPWRRRRSSNLDCIVQAVEQAPAAAPPEPAPDSEPATAVLPARSDPKAAFAAAETVLIKPRLKVLV